MFNTNDYKECGCGMCGHPGRSMTKEEKVAHLEMKESKLNEMLKHIEEVKEAVESGKETK